MRMISSKKILLSILLLSVFLYSILYIQAADRISWNKKMKNGENINYWISSDVSFSSNIREAEVEIEVPAAGYQNNMKMTKTTRKIDSQIDFYQISEPNSNTLAVTYSYLPGSDRPMKVNDKDLYDWQWCKIDLNKPVMDKETYKSRTITCVHEILHAYGGKDTYSPDQRWSIMYGYSNGTATGVTSDANAFLNQKY